MTLMELVEAMVTNLGLPLALIVYLLWDKHRTNNEYKATFYELSRSLDRNTDKVNEALTKMKGDK